VNHVSVRKKSRPPQVAHTQPANNISAVALAMRDRYVVQFHVGTWINVPQRPRQSAKT
jgi:hypothetical protein